MIRYYRHILNDPARIRAYRTAIQKAIRPGDVVLDLGSGIGTYAMLAAQAGAKVVYAVESEAVIYIAMELARRNGFAKTIQFYHGRAEEYCPPQRVDWIITEFFGASAIDLLVTRTMAETMARALKPGGSVIPSMVRIMIAPVESARLHRKEILWPRRRLYGLDFSFTTSLMANTVLHADLRTGRILATPQQVAEVRLPGELPKAVQVRRVFSCKTSGVMHGFALWFTAELMEGVTLSTAPNASRLAWQQLYLPLEEPIVVHPGQRVHLMLLAQGSPSGEIWWSWHGSVRAKTRGQRAHAFHQNSLRSIPLQANGAGGLRHGVRLGLSPKGRETQYLLSQARRPRTIDELARELRRFSQDKYRTEHEARSRIAELADLLQVAR